MHSIHDAAPADRAPGRDGADMRLERSVAATLRLIEAVCAERTAPPVQAARRQLAHVYGATRLRRRLERQRASA